MDSLTRGEKYLFIIALVMIVLVYFAGASQLLKVGGPQLVNLDYAATGRTPQGTYPPYASGGPTG